MIESPTCIGTCCVSPDFKPLWDNYYKNNNCYLSNDIVVEAPKSNGLTDDEKIVLHHTKLAWDKFVELDQRTSDDNDEFRDAIHRLQQLIALRVARRLDKDVWRQPDEDV